MLLTIVAHSVSRYICIHFTSLQCIGIGCIHLVTYSQQLTNITVSSEDVIPESTTLSVATLNRYVIMVYKVFYSSVEAALTLNNITRSLICVQPEVALDNDLQLRIEDGNVEAFVRSGTYVK